MSRFPAISASRFGAAFLLCCGLASSPGAPAPAPAPVAAPAAAAPAPAFPKNIAVPLLGARIRVNATAGLRQVGNFPVPLTPSGMSDASALLGSGFDGLEFGAGFHSLTILLPQPEIVEKVAFLDQTAEGAFSVLISGTDPQLLAQGQAQSQTSAPRAQTAFHGPSTVQAAVFQPQTASFIQIEFRLSKPGRLARFAVFGTSADTDYALSFPAGAAVPAGTKKGDFDVAALWSGARVGPLTSGRAGADPATITSDVLGSAYLFPAADPAPAFDIDLQGFRRADRAVLFLSGPPSRVEVLKIPRPAAPPSGPGNVTVSRITGEVDTLNLDGSEMHPVRQGDSLPAGKVLNVGFDSVAELEIDGSSFVRVGANSNVALRASHGDGAELSLLRGALLWQVYGPNGGGQLITPTLNAEVAGGVVAAEVRLKGESRIGLLAGTAEGAGGPGPVAIRVPSTGEYFRLHPGEGAAFASHDGADSTSLEIKSFSVASWWQESRIGAPAGGLHDGAEKQYFSAPLPPAAGDLLGSATTDGGVGPVEISFPEQPLEAVRFRITPLNSGNHPIAIVKALVFGLYAPQETALSYRADASAPVADSAQPAPSAPPASAAPAPEPAPVVVPIPVPAPPPPLPVAAAEPPAPALTPMVSLPSPIVLIPPSSTGYVAESSTVLGGSSSAERSVAVRRNSKGDPHVHY